MSSTTDAVESIRQLAAKFQGILDVANALERIGSLENAEAEVNARTQVARIAATAAEADLLVAQQKIEEATVKANDICAQAMHVIEEERAGILKEADNVRMQADEDARARVSAAETQISLLQGEAQKAKAEAEDAAAARDKAVAEGKTAGETSRAELADLEAKIKTAKESIASILGK